MELPQDVFKEVLSYVDKPRILVNYGERKYLPMSNIPSKNEVLKRMKKEITSSSRGFDKKDKNEKKALKEVMDKLKKSDTAYLQILEKLELFTTEEDEKMGVKSYNNIDELRKKFKIIDVGPSTSIRDLSVKMKKFANKFDDEDRQKPFEESMKEEKKNEAQADLAKIATKAKNPTFKQIVDNVSSKILKVDAGKELSVEKKKELRSALRKKGLKLSEISHEAQCRLKITRK